MIRIILVCLLLLSQILTVQSQEFNWATPVTGDGNQWGVKAIKDALDNTYFIGYSRTSTFEYEGVTYQANGKGDAFFAKLDANKELVWMKTIGGNDNVYQDEPLDLHIDAFGDIYLTIKATGSVFFYDGLFLDGINSEGQFGGEGVLIKVNSDGEYMWHDSGSTSSSFEGIITDTDGNVYITGYFSSSITLGGSITLTNPSTGTTKDLLVAKYQPDGTILWAKQAGGLPHNTFAYAFDIDINPLSNELIVLGKGSGEVFFDGVPMPVLPISDNATFLVSYDLDGTINWVNRVLDEQNYGWTACSSLAMSSSGIMGVCGNTINSNPEGLVGFYNSDGSVISEHTYPSFQDLRLYSITFNEWDIAYLSGFCYKGGVLGMDPGTSTIYNTTGFVVKMDKFQQVRWVKEFESSDFRNQVHYYNGKLSYAGIIANEFIYNSGQNVIINNEGDALFGDIVDNSLSAEDYLADDITIYPNPTSGLLIIKSNSFQQVEMYTINGILIKSTTKNEIDMSQYSKGIYLAKIITDKGTAVKKIVLN